MASITGGLLLASPYHNSSTVGRLSSVPVIGDPLNVTGSDYAFNYTYATADIYTNATDLQTPSVPISGTQLAWFSTINQTSTRQPIHGTAFNFTVSSPVSVSRQEVNWTLTIPKTSCSTCSVYVQFTLYGNLTKGTSENFTLTSTNNDTLIPTTICPGSAKGTCDFLGNQATPVLVCGTSTSPLVCSNPVQVNATSWVGYDLRLSFRFGWNATGEPMKASVGEVRVASIDNMVKTSSSHYMWQNSTDSIMHRATLSTISYNATVEYPANGSSTEASHTWSNEVINIYYPSGYNITQVAINSTSSGTTTLWQSSTSVPAPFEKTSCSNTPCSQSLLAINMSESNPRFVYNSNMTIIAFTPNSISQLSTLSGGVATQFFTSGDTIGVKVVNKPSVVNASTTLQTGSLTITFPTELSIPSSTVSTATGGVYNFTLPSTCGSNNQLCDTPLTVTTTFSSLFDLGNATAAFRINLLQVSLTGMGGTNSLSVQGTLQYGNRTGAPNVNATLFAIDTGTPINTPTTNNQTNPSASNLYISNVTLVNGVFTQGQSLIMLFTVVNPNNSTQAYNATVTIRHEWPGPQSHNMSVTFSLTPGDLLDDLPFNATSPQTYEASIMLTATGVQVTLENLRTAPNPPLTQTMTSSTSPVLPNAPHAGLFNITLTGMLKNGTMESPSSILSPTYAYVTPSLVPSRYLYGSPAFKTGPGGSFSETMNLPNAHILGAENLTVFVLARDAFGVVVMNNLPSSIFTESTALISTANSIGPVAEGQSATATLHLTSNSTLTNGITELITVNLVLQGNGIGPKTVATQTNVKIIPGGSQTIPFSFTAPSTVGSYTLTFTSAEYGGILTSQTLQVTILQGYIQLLIPAAIGIVAAIIILGVYLIREQREKKEDVETAKPKGPAQKPKPTSGGSPPSKSLTRTANVRS
jgi:hypothetical protein